MRTLLCGECGDEKSIQLFPLYQRTKTYPRCTRCLADKQRKYRGSGAESGKEIWRRTMKTHFLKEAQ